MTKFLRVNALLLLVFISMPTLAEIRPNKVIPYKTVGDVFLELHVFNPPEHQASDSAPAIVLFFGGGWARGEAESLYAHAEYLSSRGMVAISADYRTRTKHGTTPKEAVIDGKSAIRWVRKHARELGINPNMIVASGGSAGGQVAAAAAALTAFDEPSERESQVSSSPNALVLYNPVFDNGPDGYGYKKVKEYWRDFSPIHNLHKDMPPTAILLGTEDHLVPISTAKAFKKQLDDYGIRCDLYLYEGHKHGFHRRAGYLETLLDTDKFLTSIGYLKPQ